ncbi:RING-H2 finger protein atl43 [Phtheirospermum japonicum]|uniref:RING-type E3 ubiquitin transferase n=1 Tax=Phtheirospermum japonicum TaxID=374723 RepID=A0A830CE19_9LAMI|nr:RING-H2 finger protein atl43 [Phtheirospermum japonicum]
MGISNLLLPFFWLCITALATKTNGENGNIGDIADSTKTPPPPPPPPPATDSRTAQFKPGIAVTVGIFTTIFSITFLLLLYVKHCKPDAYSISSVNHHNPPPTTRKDPGIDRKVIQSLPIFRFSSLRGQKDGLECAVCLNKFEPAEVMRLLPKCKHAFHVECVDIWLEAHPTCPLCRYRVDPEDVLLVDGKSLYNYQPTPRGSGQGKGKGMEFSNARVSGRHSSAGEAGSSLEIIVENQTNDNALRGRVSLDSWNSRRKTGWRSRKSGDHQPGKTADIPGRRSRSLSRKDGQLPVQGDKHRLEHRIIVSGGEAAAEEGEGTRRWSDVEAADMLYLRSEMIIGGEEEERVESGSGVINGRSVSEITGMSRYSRSNNGGGRREERERRQGEGVMKRWLAWISQSQQQSTAVNSATPPPAAASTNVV